MPRGQPFTKACQRLAQLAAESRRADLHLHTNHSDGVWTPAEVVRRAAERGLGAIAITDHDTCSGLAEARVAARGLSDSLEIIVGVEITCEFQDRELHLLAYDVDPEEPRLTDALAELRESRRGRFAQMAERLIALDVLADDEPLQSCLNRGHSLGRRDLAMLLVQRGQVGTIAEAFARYLRDGGPIALPKGRLPVAEAIALVHRAGGVTSWAHPPQTIELNQVTELRDLGLDALEAVYPTFTATRERIVRELAKSAGLAITGGSDCHGPTPASRAVGACGVTMAELTRLRGRGAQEESPSQCEGLLK